MSILKSELEIRYDYSIYAAFRSIDRYNEGYVDSYNLGQFLKNNGHYASERELIAIIRRIDTDGDAKLSYSEFTEFLNANSEGSSRIAELEQTLRSRSEMKNRRNLSQYNSPLRSKAQYDSPVRPHTPGIDRVRHIATPMRNSSPLRETMRSPIRSPLRDSHLSPAKELRNTSPVRRGMEIPLRLDDEDELVRALREYINLERELENAKIALVQTPDFNVFDAFRIFDMDSRGWISHSDLKIGLNEIGICPDHEELALFFKRYDKDLDNRLRFSEFSDAFTPIDNYYAQILNRRHSNDVRGRFYSRDDCFLNQTKFEFKSIWRTHLKVEAIS